MLRLRTIQNLLAILTICAFTGCRAATPSCSSINPEVFGTLLIEGKYAKLTKLLKNCPLEILEATGPFFLVRPHLNIPREEDLPPVSVDELYGCGVSDRRGRLSPLKGDGAIPRPIPDLKIQMSNVVQRLIMKIQTLVKQYGWTKKSKCKSTRALDNSFKLLNRLLCCQSPVSCTVSSFRLPEELAKYPCNKMPKTTDLYDAKSIH